MSRSRRSRIRKRERKKRQYAQRPKQPDKPIVATRGLIADLACPISSRAFTEGLKELQSIPAIATRQSAVKGES
jgi:hypothetical protein